MVPNVYLTCQECRKGSVCRDTAFVHQLLTRREQLNSDFTTYGRECGRCGQKTAQDVTLEPIKGFDYK